MSLERCCITVASRRKRLASECLLHHWCNTLRFQGLRDVTGEMLHHGGMLKEGLVSLCCIWVNVATNGYKPCQWDRAQFWIVTVASWVMVATVLQQTTHKRRGREGDYNSRKCCKMTLSWIEGNVASGQQNVVLALCLIFNTENFRTIALVTQKKN